MKGAIIISIKSVKANGKGLKQNRILVSTDQGDLWVPEAAFLNTTGTLAIEEFINGEISVDFIKKGEKLADGSEVTEEGKLMNWLTLDIKRDELFAAKKAAAQSFMENEDNKRRVRLEAAKRRANFTPLDENNQEEPEGSEDNSVDKAKAKAKSKETPVTSGEASAFKD